jgi:hypothetical protein
MTEIDDPAGVALNSQVKGLRMQCYHEGCQWVDMRETHRRFLRNLEHELLLLAQDGEIVNGYTARKLRDLAARCRHAK